MRRIRANDPAIEGMGKHCASPKRRGRKKDEPDGCKINIVAPSHFGQDFPNLKE
jgi:hypothetical protein